MSRKTGGRRAQDFRGGIDIRRLEHRSLCDSKSRRPRGELARWEDEVRHPWAYHHAGIPGESLGWDGELLLGRRRDDTRKWILDHSPPVDYSSGRPDESLKPWFG